LSRNRCRRTRTQAYRRTSHLAVAPILVTLAARLLNLLLPPRCVGCSGRDRWLCAECLAGLPLLPTQSCRICAVPLSGPVLECPNCYRQPPPVARIHAALKHDGVARQLVLGLKYRGAKHLVEPIADLIAPLVPGGVDVLVPVPLHEGRLRQRGFNQSDLLAAALGSRTHRPVLTSALARVRETPSQTGLSPAERINNVRGAFAAPERMDGQHALLVDDVCTTGATLYACARTLRRAGALSVQAIVATRAVYGVVDA
jgi:ComF family protein